MICPPIYTTHSQTAVTSEHDSRPAGLGLMPSSHPLPIEIAGNKRLRTRNWSPPEAATYEVTRVLLRRNIRVRPKESEDKLRGRQSFLHSPRCLGIDMHKRRGEDKRWEYNIWTHTKARSFGSTETNLAGRDEYPRRRWKCFTVSKIFHASTNVMGVIGPLGIGGFKRGRACNEMKGCLYTLSP